MAEGSKCGSLAEFVARHMGGKPVRKPQSYREVKRAKQPAEKRA
jgi:hypothetical protein